jgi:hypothetical protein
VGTADQHSGGKPFEDHLRRAITHARGDGLMVAAASGVIAIATVALAMTVAMRQLSQR